MTRRLPDNITKLTANYGLDDLSHILPGDTFDVGGVEFVCSYLPDSTSERFYIVKAPELVRRYLELANEFHGGCIVELGIAEGGSTALMALAAAPQRLVAIDLEPVPLAALTEFIDRHDLGESVHPFYGVDQADREGLAAVVDGALEGCPIDLVVDDCSHQFAETRSSFETLFPRLRPGGRYLIEDWNSDHVMREAVGEAIRRELDAGNEQLRAEITASMAGSEPPERRAPLSQLAVELMLIRAISGDAVDEVVVDEHWVQVRRGPGDLDPTTFRLDDCYTDHYGIKGW